jgi:hypothetical protein
VTARPDRPSPIATRAWAPPSDWKPQRAARRAGSWPEAAFLLTTLTCPQPGEPLRCGACALLPSLLPGQTPVDLRLFCPDECPPDDLARLGQVAARYGLPPPLRRSELVQLLYRRCYKQRLPLVGYRLPAQLGQLAAGWRTSDTGDWSLIMASRPCPSGQRTAAERRRRPLLANGELEDGYRPRIRINVLDGHRASIRFQGRRKADASDRAPDGEGGKPRDHYVFPGFFVDLSTAASVQCGGTRHPSTLAASEALGLVSRRDPAERTTPPNEINGLLEELGLLAALYLRLLECHQQTPGGDRITLDQVYSAASYADAFLDAVGLELPLAHCDLSPAVHAQAMGAFFGGECGIAVRHQDVQVAYLDTAGHYPVSAHRTGASDLLRATKLEQAEEDPAELQQLLADLDPGRLLEDPALWRRLGRTICLIRPTGQTLPHRVPHGKTLLSKTAPLNCDQPLPYLLADLAAGILRGDRPPEIVSAFSVRTLPRRRRRLREVTLPSGHRFDPAREDLFLVLAEERHRIENAPDLTPEERKRRGTLLKLIANAACFGLLCQINVQADRGEAELTALDGTTRTVPVDAIEEPGRRAMPFVAASVTATGRLLLQLTCTLLEQAGSTVCGWDTDSAFTTVTPDGGRIPSPGGTLQDPNGKPAINALASSEIPDTQQHLQRLSPTPPQAASRHAYCWSSNPRTSTPPPADCLNSVSSPPPPRTTTSTPSPPETRPSSPSSNGRNTASATSAPPATPTRTTAPGSKKDDNTSSNKHSASPAQNPTGGISQHSASSPSTDPANSPASKPPSATAATGHCYDRSHGSPSPTPTPSTPAAPTAAAAPPPHRSTPGSTRAAPPGATSPPANPSPSASAPAPTSPRPTSQPSPAPNGSSAAPSAPPSNATTTAPKPERSTTKETSAPRRPLGFSTQPRPRPPGST